MERTKEGDLVEKRKGRGLNLLLYIIFIIAVLGIGLNTGVKNVMTSMIENSQVADKIAEHMLRSIPEGLPVGDRMDLIIKEKFQDSEALRTMVEKVVKANIGSFTEKPESEPFVDLTPELDSMINEVGDSIQGKLGHQATGLVTEALDKKKAAINDFLNEIINSYFDQVRQRLSGNSAFKAYNILISRAFGLGSLIVALLTALILFIRRRDLTSFMFGMGIADLIILGGFFVERLVVTQIFIKMTEELLGIGLVPSGMMDKDMITMAVMTAGVFAGAVIAKIVKV